MLEVYPLISGFYSLISKLLVYTLGPLIIRS